MRAYNAVCELIESIAHHYHTQAACNEAMADQLTLENLDSEAGSFSGDI